jgi:hypothetical protein
MAIDNPIDANERLRETEELSQSPVTKYLEEIASAINLPGMEFVRAVLQKRKEQQTHLLLEAFKQEIQRHTRQLDSLMSSKQSVGDKLRSEEELVKLAMEALRRAGDTRAEQRVKRIGAILANAYVNPASIDSDSAEEMMRIAQDLTDRDVMFLRDLFQVEGERVRKLGSIHRYDAYELWLKGPWRGRIDPELDSVFSKLESYGLVSRLAPPNSINITGDYQHRYVLLPKGVQFVDMIGSFAPKDTSLGDSPK